MESLYKLSDLRKREDNVVDETLIFIYLIDNSQQLFEAPANNYPYLQAMDVSVCNKLDRSGGDEANEQMCQ